MERGNGSNFIESVPVVPALLLLSVSIRFCHGFILRQQNFYDVNNKIQWTMQLLAFICDVSRSRAALEQTKNTTCFSCCEMGNPKTAFAKSRNGVESRTAMRRRMVRGG